MRSTAQGVHKRTFLKEGEYIMKKQISLALAGVMALSDHFCVIKLEPDYAPVHHEGKT